MSTTDKTTAMREARAEDSRAKRQRVLAAIEALQSAGAPITAAAVAATAGVSTWLVYADGVREHIDAARQRQVEPRAEAPTGQTPRAPTPVTPASLSTDLAVAHDQVRRLRADNDKLRARLRLQLGAEIDGPDKAELIARVADLDAVNRRLVAERDARAVEADHAQRQARELEDDLSAARQSLRQIIKDQNR